MDTVTFNNKKTKESNLSDLFSSLKESPILAEFQNQKELLSKTRLTKQERENIEKNAIEHQNAIEKEKKNQKRRKLEEQDNEECIIPKKSIKRLGINNGKSNRNASVTTNNNSNTNNNNNNNKEEMLDNQSTNNNNHNENKIDNTVKIEEQIKRKIPQEEVIRRLRFLRQPIRFFGETDDERTIRLRQLEIMEHERQEGASKGSKNEFSHSIANEVEKELEAAMAQSMNTQGKQSNEYEQLLEKERIKQTKYDRKRLRNEFEYSEDYVLFYFKRLLREWEKALLDRSEDEKLSAIGKHETMRQKQARRDIRPLFKQLKNRTVPIDVLEKAEKIAVSAENRNYMEAKRIFLELAIGNAPWPMGVTMVGIHERSGRSKIFSSQIAHVMNDETQRKYIHAMERLIRFAQIKYPNEDSTKNMG